MHTFLAHCFYTCFLSGTVDGTDTNSTMGPNENDISILADGKTLIAVVRMDSDGACSGGLYQYFSSVLSSALHPVI